MRIAIATENPGWQGGELRTAFAAAGVDVVFVSLRQCRIDTRAPQGLFIPGFEDCLPDGVFVRQVPGGSLEQVVLRLDYLHALKDCGVLVYNDGRAIERTVDKAMTSWLLHRAGIATPDTVAAEDVGAALPAEGDIVVKPLFGSQGKGLVRVTSGQPLPEPASFAGVLYTQRFLPPEGEAHRDLRVFVIDGEAVAAMERRHSEWISNVARGAHCTAVPAQGTPAELAVAACAAVGAAYGGVDLMQDEGGEWCVLEVNGIPAWQGLQSVCEFSIAQRLVRSFLARC